MAPDDLSGSDIAPSGIDLITGQRGRFIRGNANYVPAVSPSLAATGAFGAAVEIAGHGDVRLDLVTSVAAASATVTIQTSFDNGVTDAWRTVAAFPAQTATGTVRQVFGACDRWIRANLTALTTGPTTVSLSGEAV
jgi:hypothetical protein